MAPIEVRRRSKVHRPRSRGGASWNLVLTLLTVTALVAVMIAVPYLAPSREVGGRSINGSSASLPGVTPSSGSGSSAAPRPTFGTTAARPGMLPASTSGPEWVNISAGLSNRPPPRSNASVAWDAGDREYLLFGGESGGVALGDTWAFENGNWTQLLSAGQPGPRFGAGMAYDVHDNYTVLFGGNNSSAILADTWAFSGGHWVHLKPVAPPRGRAFPSMAYDPVAEQVIMFGGYMSSNQSASTWGFEDGNWTPLVTGGPLEPADRIGAAMAYDAADEQLVMFGGLDPATKTPIVLNDTWTFVWNTSTSPASGDWAEINGTTAPSPRFDSAVAYDASEGKVVLFGGSTLKGYALGDTWLWNSTQWVRPTLPTRDVPPAARIGAAMGPSPTPGNSPNLTSAAVFLLSGLSNRSSLDADAWYFGSLPVSVLPPKITPPIVDTNVRGQFSVMAFGGNASLYSYVWNGVPSGCATLDLPVLSCVAASSKSYVISVTVTDASGASMTSLGTIWIVNANPSVQTFTITPSPSVVSAQISLNVIVGGGTMPFTYVYTGLPTGCATENTAVFTCYPQVAGTFQISVTATDECGEVATGTTTLTVHVATTPNPAVWQYVVEGLVVGVIVIIAAVLIRRNRRVRTQRRLLGAAGGPGTSPETSKKEEGLPESGERSPPSDPTSTSVGDRTRPQ